LSFAGYALPHTQKLENMGMTATEKHASTTRTLSTEDTVCCHCLLMPPLQPAEILVPLPILRQAPAPPPLNPPSNNMVHNNMHNNTDPANIRNPPTNIDGVDTAERDHQSLLTTLRQYHERYNDYGQ
jgi:hypothetical protein